MPPIHLFIHVVRCSGSKFLGERGTFFSVVFSSDAVFMVRMPGSYSAVRKAVRVIEVQSVLPVGKVPCVFFERVRGSLRGRVEVRITANGSHSEHQFVN